MTTFTTRHAGTSPPSTARRAWSLLRLGVVAIVAVIVVAAGTLVGLRAARAGVLPGVSVDGMPVGGSSEQQLRASLERVERRNGRARVRAVRGDDVVTARAAELGYAVDIDATVAAALAPGRQSNPVTALTDHLRAFREATPVMLVERVDAEPLERWAETTARALSASPREGGVRFDGADVLPVRPRSGARVLPGPLRDAGRAAALAGGGEIPVATEPVDPVTTAADVAAAVRRARRAVSGPVTLSRNGRVVTLTPDEIAGLLSSRVVRGGRDPRVRLRVDAQRLTEVIGASTIAAFEREPVSARVEVRGRRVAIVAGSNGFRYDAKAAAAQLREVATGDGLRSTQLAGDVVEPELTTAEARALRIVEPVSSFTTEHPCCMTRVKNIHRIADIVDGVVIEPGETFSVNDFVGRRTRAKGFVAGGAIQDGKFVDEVGGGVSQFATTLYNAAYFGGYAIPQHQRHSYYISRYPEGREATLNFPTVDLQITNSSPHGMLLETDYTDTSVTVTVWGKRWVDVSSKTSPRTNVTDGETQYKENNDLPRGARVVVQEKVPGFDVTVTRTLRFPDGHRDREEIFTRYLPQPRIIERNRRGG